MGMAMKAMARWIDVKQSMGKCAAIVLSEGDGGFFSKSIVQLPFVRVRRQSDRATTVDDPRYHVGQDLGYARG